MTATPSVGDSERPALFALAVLTALALAPLWSSRYLAMVDLPAHLGQISILHRLDDPDLPFGRFFAIRPQFTPYLGYYWTLHVLAYAIPLEWANRLLLSAYVAGLALGAAAFAQALGRSRWLALFALPLAYSFEFYMGFVSHLMAVALMLGSLAAHAARLQGRLRGPGGALMAAALPLACLVTHVQPYLYLLAGLLVMIVLFPGHRLQAILAAAPSMGLFAYWFAPIVAGRAGGPPLSAHLSFDPFTGRVAAIGTVIFNPFKDWLDSILFLGVAAAWLWAMAASLRGEPSRLGRAERLTPILLAAGAIGGYLMMPAHAPLMQFIHHRYATIAALMLAASVPLPPGASSRSWRSTLAALCVAHTIYIAVQFRRFDAEVGDFRTLAAKVEAGSCIAQIEPNQPSGVMRDPGVYSSFAAYVTLWRGAVPGSTFAYTRHSPLVHRTADGSIAASLREAALPEVTSQEQHIQHGTLYAAYGGFYRYFLTPRGRDPVSLFGAGADRLVKLGDSGTLSLYLNPAGTCDR
jgi:hypothetical protein